jgi:NAD-dependent SIR2 family protein deacetylase
MKAQCIKCGEWFPISKELENLIEDGIIHPVDVNTCPECTERLIEALEYEYNELEN